MGDRFIRFGQKGSSDILGIIPGGRFVAIECKATGAKQSDSQREFQAEIEKHGGLYVLAYEIKDLIQSGL